MEEKEFKLVPDPVPILNLASKGKNVRVPQQDLGSVDQILAPVSRLKFPRCGIRSKRRHFYLHEEEVLKSVLDWITENV